LIIQTILLYPSGAVWTDEAPNMSRLDPSGTVQSDAELLPRNRKVVGSNPTSDSTSPQLSAHLSGHEQIQDTSRQGRYHNHRYATLAAELGLDVARDPRIGWSLTTLPQPTATSRNMLACLCPCERRIRVARATLAEAPVICGACQGEFEPVDT
jgi:hypothetical protein